MLTRLWHGRDARRPSTRQGRSRRRQSATLWIESLETRCLLSTDVVLQWNQGVLNAIRTDKPTLGFTTRDLAIVHTAIYDAVNAIEQTSAPFHVQVQVPAGASPEAAAAAAGLFTAGALFPTDLNMFQATFQTSLAGIPDGTAKNEGIEVGRIVAEQTLISRIPDGADAFVPYTPGTNPGDWQPAPPNFGPAQTPQWGFVTPFAIPNTAQFLPPPPPALTSQAYTDAFNELKDFGRVDSTVRTPAETEIAQFWEGKGGTAQVPGYWNEIAQSAALSQGNTLEQNARLFAELNVALADSVIVHFAAKYTYSRWRPVTAIQNAGETGNPDTSADPTWLPLLTTPPNPSYVSGHGAVSGAAATILAQFFGTDNISFNLATDDLSGVTHSFSSFSAAATEAENSVVWGGIHFRFDATAGDTLGRSIAQFVTQDLFQPAANTIYQQTNLVADVPGLAAATDPNLINAWGLSLTPAGQFRVSDNGTGLSTVYDINGNAQPGTVQIPLPASSTATTASPTGNIFNPTTDFVISENGVSAPATNLFATEDGTIAAWNAQVDENNALLAVDNSAAGAVYKSLTLGSNAQGNFLYATNFHNGTVDVFNSTFQQVQLSGAFADPNLPAGFVPFGIRNINGTLFVTYALQDAKGHDDVAGAGNGFVDEFDTDGNLLERFASQGQLNSPHGIALAPSSFGRFSNALLLGNFGDGRINAFDPATGRFLGQLSDANGQPLANVGLWAITFGNGAGGTSTNTLYFNAGLNKEQDGLFASVSLAGGNRANAARRLGDSAPLATMLSGAAPRRSVPTDLLSGNTAQENQPVPPLVEDVASKLAAFKTSLSGRGNEGLQATSTASQREQLDVFFSSAELEQSMVLA